MRLLSVVTFDVGGAQPHNDPETPARMAQLIGEMRGKGVLVDTGGRDGEMFEMKIARKNGGISVTDGPFTEAKELVGGYAVLEVKDREEAIAWTQRFLDLLGTGTCYLHEVSPPPE